MNFGKKIAELLFELTADLHCRIIMVNDKPYLERYYLGKMFGFSFYIHRFLDSDGDRSLHDHPWSSVSILMSGGYHERVLDWFDPKRDGVVYTTRHLEAPRINIIPRAKFHQIINPRAETWTLFIHGKRVKHWGFLNVMNDLKDREDVKSVAYVGAMDESGDRSAKYYKSFPKGKDAGREPFKL